MTSRNYYILRMPRENDAHIYVEFDAAIPVADYVNWTDEHPERRDVVAMAVIDHERIDHNDRTPLFRMLRLDPDRIGGYEYKYAIPATDSIARAKPDKLVYVKFINIDAKIAELHAIQDHIKEQQLIGNWR